MTGLMRAVVQFVVPKLKPPTASVLSTLNITVEEDGSQPVDLEKMIDISESPSTQEILPDLQNCKINCYHQTLCNSCSSV